MPWPVHPTGFFGAQGDNDTYQIQRSLRFNSADSAYLNRTPASAGNRKTWTWSGWVKLGSLGTTRFIFGANSGSTAIRTGTSSDTIGIDWNGGTSLRSTQVLRDVSSWGHLVVSVDTTQVTASNRIRVYWNGSEITSWATDNRTTTPSQNSDGDVNNSSSHIIGSTGAGSYYDGYLAEIYLIDGQALTQSSFGETDALTGRWKAKAYSGTYGTNGFYLNFSDNSSLTTTSNVGIGKDFSGNGNYWATNGLSVTAGAGNDSLVDSPTNYGTDTGVGGEVRGNYCTLNSIRYGSGSVATMSDGNLYFANSGNAGTAIGTFAIPSTGKWYWEAVVPTQTYNFMMVGVVKDQELLSNLNSAVGILSSGYAVYSSDGKKYNNNVGSNYMGVNNQNTVMTIAYDANTGSLYVGAGGSWANGSGATNQTWSNAVAAYTGITGTVYPAISFDTGNCYINFGQRPFAYTAPAGFKALCTTNLPTPTIKKPSSYMDVVTYTGNGSTQTISSLGFSPDLVWIKSRSGAYHHRVYDTTRGVTKVLYTSLTDAEVTVPDANDNFVSFNSNGFTLGSTASTNGLNENSQTFVSWAWDEAPIAGMDIVSYTGNGTNRTIAHNLGVAPKMLIVKDRDSGISDWTTWHSGLTSASYYINLNSTAAQNSAASVWNSTAPTSSNFSLGTNVGVNNSGNRFIAYLFAEVEGFSKFGSYTGNGSSDGPFVWCGFRPRFLMTKRTDNVFGGDWYLYDSARDTYNAMSAMLYANANAAETSVAAFDATANGFKVRSSAANYNASGGTYIFAAFAESPFKYARAR